MQYRTWLSTSLHGNLGSHTPEEQSVTELLGDRLPKTMLLAGISVLLALVVSIPLGFLQALRRNSHGRLRATGITFVFYSTPGVLARARPDHGVRDPLARVPRTGPSGNISETLSHPRGLVLPVLTITLVSIAFFSRYVRSSTLENLLQDYVRTARAKGAGTRARRRPSRDAQRPRAGGHAARPLLPFVFAGTLISEEIFNYPGMGLLFYNAAVAAGTTRSCSA